MQRRSNGPLHRPRRLIISAPKKSKFSAVPTTTASRVPPPTLFPKTRPSIRVTIRVRPQRPAKVESVLTNREKILIVEPDPQLQQRLLELLHSAGYDVSSAPTQQEGFEAVQKGGIDLFLLAA